jgi:putative membrane protein
MELFIKLLHIGLVSGWIACALYLPMLFRAYCRAADDGRRGMLMAMVGRLYVGVMTPSAIGAVVLGTGLLFYGFDGGWLPLKLSLVLLLVLFHLYCGRVLLLMEKGLVAHGPAYYGLLGVVPIPLLVAIVALAVTKPL